MTKTPKVLDDRPDAVIDRLYEVAVDPSRYEDLLDHWEAMIGPHRAKIPVGKGDIIGLEHLSGHVERADMVLDRVLQSDVPHGPSALLAEIDRAAAFAVDGLGKIQAVNAGATALLGIRGGDTVQSLDIDPDDVEILVAQITHLLRSNSDAPVVLRVRRPESDRLVIFHLRAIHAEDTSPYVLVISSDIHWPNGFSDMLRSAFGFSQAEVEVVRALTEGKTLQQVAEDRGRSIDTVRAQLKSVLGKSETRSQTELVRLTLSTMEIATYTVNAGMDVPEMSEGYGSLQPRPFHTLSLTDGRRLDYLVLGDPMGTPVIYLPLDYGLMRWPAEAEADAHARGLRIIAAVRPGYGASTPLPKRVSYVDQIADDVMELMDHLGLQRAPILSLGSDSHIAFTLGARYPDRIAGLVACAGVLPLTRPEQYDRMDKWHRFILAGARYTPHLLPFMVKAGFALAKRLGKEGFLNAVYGKSAADVATFRDRDVLEAMVVGSEVCLSDTHSAHDAFAREVIAMETVDWRPKVEAAKGTFPVVLMNGLQDPQVPPETLEEFQRDYPWITFDVHPDCGQLLFFVKWRKALDQLQEFLT